MHEAYLKNYFFDWGAFEVLLGDSSALDGTFYSKAFKDKSDVEHFIQGYGFNLSDPIQKAELFGNYQEALEFVRRYFLKEGNSQGYDYIIPPKLLTISDIADLFLFASGLGTKEESLWAALFLKVMHTILHANKDLRYQYFSTIQTQIFDRFYRFMDRDSSDQLYLKSHISSEKIPLVDFQTKSKKTRDSIIIKLLHKKESVAEELFDRIGIRFVTKNKLDIVRVISFLLEHHIVILHNIKRSRSHNSVMDLKKFRKGYYPFLKDSMRHHWPEEEFYEKVENLAAQCDLPLTVKKHNHHSSLRYRAIHFTGRQLIHYKSPLTSQLVEIRRMAKKKRVQEGNSDLLQKISEIDMSNLSREIRFFYPFEVQITDRESHEMNTKGEASHKAYKKAQLIAAMERLMRPIREFYELKRSVSK